MVTIYTIAYNEELILPFFIKWYRKRFPNCHIVVYDNYSTDKTEQIALEFECEVIKYDSGNQIRDDLYLEIKNNCWKTAKTDWVIVCDVDELIDINEETLKSMKFDIIGGKGYQMCGEVGDRLEDIDKGVYDIGYSKIVCFNKSRVKSINYEPGCHNAKPEGEDLHIIREYAPLYHFKWINDKFVFERYNLYKSRLSNINKKNKWGFQYSTSLDVQKNYYEMLLKNRVKVL